VDPRSAGVSIAVRHRRVEPGVPGSVHAIAHEAGWISPGDHVVLQGRVDARKRTMVADRISSSEHGDVGSFGGPVAPAHLVPPGGLALGTPEGTSEGATELADGAGAAAPASDPPASRRRNRRRPNGGGMPEA
jgi:hypothetical protein